MICRSFAILGNQLIHLLPMDNILGKQNRGESLQHPWNSITKVVKIRMSSASSNCHKNCSGFMLVSSVMLCTLKLPKVEISLLLLHEILVLFVCNSCITSKNMWKWKKLDWYVHKRNMQIGESEAALRIVQADLENDYMGRMNMARGCGQSSKWPVCPLNLYHLWSHLECLLLNNFMVKSLVTHIVKFIWHIF